MALADAYEVVWEAARLALRPDPVLTVSEWADQHRFLSQRASAEPGSWRTERTPYLREIMDCLSATSSIEKVVFMKGAQVGGTEAGNNWLGYVIDNCPGPMLMVQPTVEMAKRNSKTRIAPRSQEQGQRQQPPVERVPRRRGRDGGSEQRGGSPLDARALPLPG
jgi:phage terminase large subunit GpA-like protein